jgi:hypothetical protein
MARPAKANDKWACSGRSGIRRPDGDAHAALAALHRCSEDRQLFQ